MSHNIAEVCTFVLIALALGLSVWGLSANWRAKKNDVSGDSQPPEIAPAAPQKRRLLAVCEQAERDANALTIDFLKAIEESEKAAARAELEARIKAIEEREKAAMQLAAQDEQKRRLLAVCEQAQRDANARRAPPVDRSARVLSDGSPVTADHREINPDTGQQKGYVVLTPEERGKGFVRPVRRSYKHVGRLQEFQNSDHPSGEVQKWSARVGCGEITSMGRALAETYARDPGFYSATFCGACRKHLPLDEFVWAGTNEQVGS